MPVHFRRLNVENAFAVQVERLEDERGWFGRVFSVEEFSDAGLNPEVNQCSLSFNRREKTLRGMHLQTAPHEESKLVLCVAGSIYDVLLDLRPGSPTYRQWTALHLTHAEPVALFVPPGVAHGFMTLEDNSTVYYQISASYHAESSSGVRWNDPAFHISWPAKPVVISRRDASFPDYKL